MNFSTHFVYQRVHILDSRALDLETHLRLAGRALKTIYNIDSQLDASLVEAQFSELFRAQRLPKKGSATALICIEPDQSPHIEPERALIERGYAHSPLRPKGVTFNYSIPYAGLPTNFQLSAMAFFDDLAMRQTGGSARSIRRDGNKLISTGDAALFGIRGRKILTAPIEDGAMESIERQMIMSAARAAGSRLEMIEEAVQHSELTSFDELFFVNAAGITSFAECDGAKFSVLIAPRLL